MTHENPETFRWEEWDWRPLARLIAWFLLAVLWARWRNVVFLPLLQLAFRELVLGWLLTFGLLTYVQALIATGAWRLALELDAAVYALSERLVRPFAGRASFAANFAAAFGAELALVYGTIHLWHAARMGGRVAVLLAEIPR